MTTEGLKVELIKPKLTGQVVFPPRSNFVKVTHIESGITVTKEGRSQLKARDEAIDELEVLVELWGGK